MAGSLFLVVLERGQRLGYAIALAVEGPIREYYLSGELNTPDKPAWRTEIGWPIFQTSSK